MNEFEKGKRMVTAVKIDKVKKNQATVIEVFGRRFVYNPKTK